MSESHLPEDLKRWPQNPYALLGVEPGAPAPEVRRAYTRLIRRYKPELYPEHFRRIRDAFEAVQRFGAFDFARPPAEDLPAGPPRFEAPRRDDAGDARRRPDLSDDGGDLTPPLPSPALWDFPARTARDSDGVDRLWERACQGEERDAYLALRTLADRSGDAAEVCLRLYWLLRMAPEIHPGESPCSWLVRALCAGGWHGPCRELYRREVERRPAEALSERFDDLLQTQAPLPVLAEWVGWRWRAAGRLNEWKAIVADLTPLRPRFTAGLDDEAWARLLLVALDHLAWITTAHAEEMTRACRDEVEHLTHLHARLDLHRLDVFIELSDAWKALHAAWDAPPLLDLVPRSWTRSSSEMRLPLMAALKDLLARPEKALATFDAIRHESPVVFVQLANLIDGVVHQPPYRECGDVAPDELRAAAADFLELIPSPYVPPRDEFLRFCVRECVLPREAFQAMQQLPNCPNNLWLLGEDDPIRTVCVAYRWFWG